MLEELDTLESKIAQLLERHNAIRAENLRLREQVSVIENANRLLTERLSEARSRMESLYNKLQD